MKQTRILLLAFAAMLSVGVASCGKDDNGSGNGGNSNSGGATRYTLTVLPNNANWGTATGSGTYADGTNVTIEAAPATGFYFIKWSDGVVSNPRTVTVGSDLTLYALFSSNPNDPNPYNPGPDPQSQPTDDWVDLGLPSGLLWASCNVGATAPEEYGDYFAWGETATKEVYNWSTYHYCTVDGEGNMSTLTKYNTMTYFGTVDSLTTLEPGDDAATANMGGDARTPTYDEWNELLNNTTSEWTTLNGVSGRKFTAPNGKSIFLPAAGGRFGSEPNLAGSDGDYWSSSLYADEPDYARLFSFHSGDQFMSDYGYRDYGFSVRAVRQN